MASAQLYVLTDVVERLTRSSTPAAHRSDRDRDSGDRAERRERQKENCIQIYLFSAFTCSAFHCVCVSMHSLSCLYLWDSSSSTSSLRRETRLSNICALPKLMLYLSPHTAWMSFFLSFLLIPSEYQYVVYYRYCRWPRGRGRRRGRGLDREGGGRRELPGPPTGTADALSLRPLLIFVDLLFLPPPLLLLLCHPSCSDSTRVHSTDCCIAFQSNIVPSC